jgi:hypothetical protein
MQYTIHREQSYEDSYFDSLTLYRGVGGAVTLGEDATAMPLESWTDDPEMAAPYAERDTDDGVVLEAEVPVTSSPA